MNPQKFARIAESLRQYRRAELKEFEEDSVPDRLMRSTWIRCRMMLCLNLYYRATPHFSLVARELARARCSREPKAYCVSGKICYLLTLMSRVFTTYSIQLRCLHDQWMLQKSIWVSAELTCRKAFLGSVISELLKELDRLCEEMSLWDIWRGKKKSLVELRGDLSRLQREVKEAKLAEQEFPILQQITRKWKARQETERSKKLDGGTERGRRHNWCKDDWACVYFRLR